MEALPYLLKVNICWVVFYGCYWLLFRKHTFFMLNRAYLLFSLVISFVIPAVELQQTVTIVENASVVATAAGAVTVGEAPASANFIGYLLFTCYCAGVLAMVLALIKAIYQVRRIVQSGICVPMEGYHLVISQRQYARSGSFSFLKWMIISNDDYEQNFEPIFTHEMVHIRQRHTLDILLIEVLKAAFWFNPALWLYKRALQDTHEFLADEQATDRDYYATFLLTYAKSAIATSVTNQFFNASLLKKRIHMIYRSRTAAWLKGKYLLLMPVLALAVVLMAARKYVYEERNVRPDNAKASDLLTIPKSNNANRIQLKSAIKPFLPKKEKPAARQMLAANERARILLDRWPGLPNGNKFIANTLKYPRQAYLDRVEGQVLVSFLVDTEGNISDPKIEKGVRKDLDNEAMRVVRLMPRWRPAQKDFKTVAVRYTMNIAFNIAVDTLPLAVKETTPGFWGNRSIYSLAPTPPLGKKHLKAFYEDTTIDLQDSVPPTTSLRRFGVTLIHSLPDKPVDLKIKYRKK